MYSSKIQDKTQAAGYSTPRLVNLGSIQAFVLGAATLGGDGNPDTDNSASAT